MSRPNVEAGPTIPRSDPQGFQSDAKEFSSVIEGSSQGACSGCTASGSACSGCAVCSSCRGCRENVSFQPEQVVRPTKR